MNYTTKIAIVLFLCFQSSLFGQKIIWENYIKKYNSYAISEMKRTGIPASIKMAQAILESNAGRSVLATKANNHFGIKCGGSWVGGTYYREDDDYGSDGKLIESCFRSYDSSVESFIAHSEFLMTNSRRYGFLFDLEPTDYVSWAKGLKKAGYATNPAYADLLISVIEKHNLAQFDTRSLDQLMADAAPKEKATEAELKMIRVNKIRAVRARHGDSPYSIANKFKVDIKRLLIYNENLFAASQNLDKNTVIYLQPKRNKFRGRQKYHVVRNGETLRSISQSYGIKYVKLSKRNHVPLGLEVKIGEKVALRGRVKKKDTPMYDGKEIKEIEDFEDELPMEEFTTDREDALTFFEKVQTFFEKEEVEEEDMDLDMDPMWESENKNTNKGSESADLDDYTIEVEKEEVLEDSFTGSIDNIGSEIVVEENVQTTEKPTYEIIEVETKEAFHVVAKGETLYGICRENGLTLENLRLLNNLQGDTIYPGQKIRIQ